MICIRSVISMLFFMLLHNQAHAQEKPDTSNHKIPDSLSLQIKDFDGDGVNDAEDKCINERGPVSNFGCPMIAEKYVYIDHGPKKPDVFFKTNSSYLSAAAIESIEKVVKILKENPDYGVSLQGYTDSVGNKELNRKLSIRRIKVIRHYLLSAGIDKNRVIYEIYGSERPIDDNRTKEGRSKNRRVNLHFYMKRIDN